MRSSSLLRTSLSRCKFPCLKPCSAAFLRLPLHRPKSGRSLTVAAVAAAVVVAVAAAMVVVVAVAVVWQAPDQR